MRAKRALLAPKTVSKKFQLRAANFSVNMDLKRSAGRATLPTNAERPVEEARKDALLY